jgi:hypothetical protein
LTSTNYLPWRNQFDPILISEDLLGYVDGSLLEPPSTILDKDSKSVPNPEYTSWKQMDQLVLSLIYSSLTEEAMCEVLGSTSSRDAWLALEESFSDKSKTHEL